MDVLVTVIGIMGLTGVIALSALEGLVIVGLPLLLILGLIGKAKDAGAER